MSSDKRRGLSDHPVIVIGGFVVVIIGVVTFLTGRDSLPELLDWYKHLRADSTMDVSPTSSITEDRGTIVASGPLPSSPPYQDSEIDSMDWVVLQEEVIGKYVYRIWKAKDSNLSGTIVGEYLTLSSIDEPAVNIEAFFGTVVSVNLLSGRDITGEGNPDLIIETYSGGAHCCLQYFVIDLGEFFITKQLQTRESNCPGEFKDLDHDGSYEFITCDDILAYTYCSFAATPLPTVILKFRPGVGYVPATPDYRTFFDITTRIIADTSLAEQGQVQFTNPQNVDLTSKAEYFLCPAIQVALDHLYTGDYERAEQEFMRLYQFPDSNEVWNEIYRLVSESYLFTLQESPKS